MWGTPLLYYLWLIPAPTPVVGYQDDDLGKTSRAVKLGIEMVLIVSPEFFQLGTYAKCIGPLVRVVTHLTRPRGVTW
jgi:hypothetical protein